MVAEQLIRIVWGAQPRRKRCRRPQGRVILRRLPVLALSLLLAWFVALVLLGVWLLLHKTSFGRVVAPASQRPTWVGGARHQAAALHDRDRGARVAMAAAGGALFAPITIVHPRWGARSSRSPSSWW